jgi:hypothetical protein
LIYSDPKKSGISKLYLQKAAEDGNSDAQVSLGMLLLQEKLIISINEREKHKEKDKQAISLLLSAAQKNNSNAQFVVGLCCLLGIGTKQDRETGMNWINSAAQKGHFEALFHIYTCVRYNSNLPNATNNKEEGTKIIEMFQNTLNIENELIKQYLSEIKRDPDFVPRAKMSSTTILFLLRNEKLRTNSLEEGLMRLYAPPDWKGLFFCYLSFWLVVWLFFFVFADFLLLFHLRRSCFEW